MNNNAQWKRILACALVTVVLSVLPLAQSFGITKEAVQKKGQFSPSILGMRFGASRDEVKARYQDSQPDYETEERLVYNSPVIELRDVNEVVYMFFENKLYAISLLLNKETTQGSAKNLLDTYDYYKNALTGKYGAPKSDDGMSKVYDNDRFRLVGIEIGAGKYESKWDTEDMFVELALKGDNYKLDFHLDYYYKPIAENKQRAAQKELLQNL